MPTTLRRARTHQVAHQPEVEHDAGGVLGAELGVGVDGPEQLLGAGEVLGRDALRASMNAPSLGDVRLVGLRPVEGDLPLHRLLGTGSEDSAHCPVPDPTLELKHVTDSRPPGGEHNGASTRTAGPRRRPLGGHGTTKAARW